MSDSTPISNATESTLTGWKNKQAPRARPKDKLDDFTSSTTIDIDNPRLWWIQHQKDYPRLSVMALDLLAIPAMSSEVERVFSSTGLMITDRRNRLKEDIIEAVECMKSWQSNGGLGSFKNIEQVRVILEQLEGKTMTVRQKDKGLEG